MRPGVFPIAAGGSAARWFCGVFGLFTLGLGLFLGTFVFRGPSMVTLDVSDEGLRVRGDIYGRHLPRVSLRSDEAHAVDRAAEPGLAPTRRTNGIGLPNYQSGWFRLENGAKALLFVTDWSRAVIVPTNEGFDLIVSPEKAAAFLEAIRQPAAAAASFSLTPSPPGSTALSRLLQGLVLLPPLGVSLLLAYVAGSTRRVRFELSSEGLRIRGDMFGRMIPRDKLMVEDARILDLKADPARKPSLRTCGVGLPGYLSGWFRLKDRSKALLFLTDQSRAVFLPTLTGYALLLSPADPEGFLTALKG